MITPSQNQIRNDYLSALGIVPWVSKQALDQFVLKTHKPIQNAQCMVILPNKPPTALSEKVLATMLHGMLSVLNLASNQLGIFWEENTSSSSILNEILFWSPYTILLMGSEWSSTFISEKGLSNPDFLNLGIPLHTTYHPSELMENPTLKPKAYQDLLNLKKVIGI